MNYIKYLIPSICIALITGCSAGIKDIKKIENLNNLAANEAIAILKLSPNNYRHSDSQKRISFSKRGVDNKGLHKRQLLLWEEESSSVVNTIEQYAVFKIELSTPKLTTVLVAVDEKDPTTQKLHNVFARYCGGNIMATNVLEPGVHYLGEFHFDKQVMPSGEVKEQLAVNMTLDGVTEFLHKHHPSIPTDNIKLSPLKAVFDHTRCHPQTTVIYI